MAKSNFKIFLLIFGMIYLISYTVQAQEGTSEVTSNRLHYGGKFGLTYPNTFNNGEGISMPNFTVGGIVSYDFTEMISLQFEVNYIRQGGVHSDSEVTLSGPQVGTLVYSNKHVRLDNLVLPLLLRVNFETPTLKPYMVAGVSYTWNLSAQEIKDITLLSPETDAPIYSNEKTIENVSSKYETSTFNAELGGGVQFEVSGLMLFAEAKYMQAFTDMNRSPVLDAHQFGELYPSSLLISVGVTF